MFELVLAQSLTEDLHAGGGSSLSFPGKKREGKKERCAIHNFSG